MNKFEFHSKRCLFHDYLDNLEKLYEPNLPDQIYFYNKLKNENISDSEYEHAKLVQ